MMSNNKGEKNIYMKGIIFLDLDGVVNNTTDVDDELNIDHGPMYIAIRNLGPMRRLFEKCRENDIKIVISSTWSVFGFNKIYYFFKDLIDEKILKEVMIDTTEYLIYDGSNHRSIEIAKYLFSDEKLKDLKNYLFIDDSLSEFTESDLNRLVHINQEIGLTVEKVDESIDIIINNKFIDKPTYKDQFSKEKLNDIMKMKAIFRKVKR